VFIRLGFWYMGIGLGIFATLMISYLTQNALSQLLPLRPNQIILHGFIYRFQVTLVMIDCFMKSYRLLFRDCGARARYMFSYYCSGRRVQGVFLYGRRLIIDFKHRCTCSKSEVTGGTGRKQPIPKHPVPSSSRVQQLLSCI
jgi:hypothetical protein